jgi:hypothetical protein
VSAAPAAARRRKRAPPLNADRLQDAADHDVRLIVSLMDEISCTQRRRSWCSSVMTSARDQWKWYEMKAISSCSLPRG